MSMNWLNRLAEWLTFRETEKRVVVVSTNETRRLDRLAKKNTERLLKAGVRPKNRDTWCTAELEALSEKLQPKGNSTVTPLRKVSR